MFLNIKTITTGEIVVTIGCYVDDNSEMYKGLFIVTNNNDSLLSFNISDENIYVQYGCYGIPSKTMPYKFTFRYLSPTDSEYVHYIMPLSNAMLPGIDAEKFKQAKIIKHNVKM